MKNGIIKCKVMICYCNSNKAFSECCEPIILGLKNSETAEQLMRSRYSGYVVANIDYLMKSHHASTRPLKEKQAILKWTKSIKWVALEIIAKQKGLTEDNEGFVEFKALFFENGKMGYIHENSYFVRENGVWFYKSGVHK